MSESATEQLSYEEGTITDVVEHHNGYNIVFKEERSEFELGIPLYREDLGGFFPIIGDQIVMGFPDEDLSLLVKLEINGRTVIERTVDEAKIWRQVRRHELKARQLRALLKDES